MKLFQKVGAVLPGAKKLITGGPAPEEPEEDIGGFGPPGGMIWTTPGDVLSDRPRGARPAQPSVAGQPTGIPVTDHPAAPAADIPAPASPPQPEAMERAGLMSTDIAATAGIAGFIGSCLVDSDSGFMLAAEGGDGMDLEAAAALNTQFVKAEHQVIEVLGLDDHIEDILITMGKQLHFIRPLENNPTVFLYVALDKKAANLGMARMQVNKIEGGLRM